MTFTVTYRNKTGAKAEVEIEAANRAACVAECKARGIAPVGIREGRSGKSVAPGGAGRAANVSAAPRGGTLKAAILAAAVLAAAGGAWLWLAGARDAGPYRAKPPAGAKSKVGDRPEARPSRPRDASPAAATNAPLRTAIATNVPPSDAGDPYGGKWRGQKIVSYSIKTNGWSTYEHIVTADGKKHGVIGSSVKPIFDNGSDQMLAMAVRASRDSETPPMPLSPLLESDFLESLKKPIVIKEDDSDEVKELVSFYLLTS